MSGAIHPIPLDAFTACLGAILTLPSVVVIYVFIIIIIIMSMTD
jgi:hypothetical protein